MGKFAVGIFGIGNGASPCAAVLLWGKNERLECGEVESTLRTVNRISVSLIRRATIQNNTLSSRQDLRKNQNAPLKKGVMLFIQQYSGKDSLEVVGRT